MNLKYMGMKINGHNMSCPYGFREQKFVWIYVVL
jgi:hypothetical protein